MGSSGYQQDDLKNSIHTLRDQPQFTKIITGKVYGIESVKLNSIYSLCLPYSLLILTEDSFLCVSYMTGVAINTDE